MLQKLLVILCCFYMKYDVEVLTSIVSGILLGIAFYEKDWIMLLITVASIIWADRVIKEGL